MKNDGAVAMSMTYIIFFVLGLFVLDANTGQVWMPPIPRNMNVLSGLFSLLIGAWIMWMPLRRKWVAALVGTSLLAGVVLALLGKISAPLLPAFTALLGVVAVRALSKEKLPVEE